MIRRTVLSLAGAAALASPALAQRPAGDLAGDLAGARRQQADPAPFDTTFLTPALRARSIGPAIMGGRVTDIELHPTDPYTYYVGLGTAGIMKTTDDGTTWSAVFEREKVAAVGDLAISPSDPDVVWVGTGEANDRNSVSWGGGVYRSTDGGGSWTRAGLEGTRAIGRVIAHPTDPRTAWVAAVGDVWSPTERGCYKTTDAGQSWRKTLSAPAPYERHVGCGDMAIDPSDPNVLYAAMYARRRTPWSFAAGPDYTDGRDLGGIFKSTDGGVTWRKLSGGLPTGTGRIGLAVSASSPRVVYAIVQSDAGGTSNIDDVQSKRGGVFRSNDGGESWTRMSSLNPRPFYFSQIRVDPRDDQKVYVLGFALHVSQDGGRTWREDRAKNVHPDLHALVIDPRESRRLLLGTDGGIYQSHNAGGGWRFMNGFAAGQFYRIQVDNSQPYRICGGLQDNLNWVGPSRTRSAEGITHADWINISGGDGFYCFFDARNPDIVFAESQQGYVHRFDLRSGAVKGLRPEPAEGQMGFRFHWNSPLIQSRHTPGVAYLAGDRVFQLTDNGESWRAISPDLSAQISDRIRTTGSGAENYGVVYTLAESPVRAGLLWAGTDDGKLWITENDGGSWTDLTRNLPAAVRGEWISRVEPGHADPRVAYLAVDAHRSGNMAPLAYRTADGGRTWQSVAGNLPADGPVKVLREDPNNPDLLFAGTEFGLYASLDRGRGWRTIGNLPTVAVDDILIHPRDLDLVIATHGRSLYIIDDIRALEMLGDTVRGRDAVLFPIRPATAFEPMPGWVDYGGTVAFRGANPPAGALITYYVRRLTGDEVGITVTDSAGATVANLTAPGVPGLNRVAWDLRYSQDVLSGYGGEGRRFVRPGEYTVTLSYGGAKETQKVRVDVLPGIETR